MAKKKKPIDNTEKALTAFDIAAELQTITQKIIDQEGELVEGDMEAGEIQAYDPKTGAWLGLLEQGA